jgi:hypothetical protein
MQLEVKPYEQIKPIEFNYEELKTQLLTKLDDYKHLQYTSDQIQAAKTDRANLNSLKKALNDERIRREKEFLEPFNTFKAQIRELCDLIDEPVKLIDAQIKEVENREKEEKREQCRKIFDDMASFPGKPDWLQFEQIFNEKWLNKTCSIKSITDEIVEKLKKIAADITVLSELEYSFEAIEEYKRSLDVSAAMNEGKRIAEIQKRKAEIEQNVVVEQTETAEIPFVDGEVREIIPDEPKAEETRVWLSFRAYLSKSDALELKAFLNAMGIQYEAIK